MINLKVAICTAIGICGGIFTTLFGGWTEDMITLILFMAIDFVMGLMVAGVFRKSQKSETGALDSRIGWMGLCKKCVTLFFVLVAHRLDVSLDTNYIKTATVIAFIVNEAISVVENAGLMGMPLPEALERAIDVLKQKKEFGVRESK